MKKTALHLSLSLAAMLAASSFATAADIPPPAPTWTGPYVGVFGGGTFVEGHYDYGMTPK